MRGVIPQFAAIRINVRNRHERGVSVHHYRRFGSDEIRSRGRHRRQGIASNSLIQCEIQSEERSAARAAGRYCRDACPERRNWAFQNVSYLHHTQIPGWWRRHILRTHPWRHVLYRHRVGCCIHSGAHHERSQVAPEHHAFRRFKVLAFVRDAVGQMTQRRIHCRVRQSRRTQQDWLLHRLVDFRRYKLRCRTRRAMHDIHLHNFCVKDASCVQKRINNRKNDCNRRRCGQLLQERKGRLDLMLRASRSHQSEALVAHDSCAINCPRIVYSIRKVTHSSRVVPVTYCTLR